MSVDLQANVVTVQPARDRAVALHAIPEAVRASGYRPGRMLLRASGRFATEGGVAAFRIDGWPRAYAWIGDRLRGAGEEATILAEVVVQDGDAQLAPVLPARLEAMLRGVGATRR